MSDSPPRLTKEVLPTLDYSSSDDPLNTTSTQHNPIRQTSTTDPDTENPFVDACNPPLLTLQTAYNRKAWETVTGNANTQTRWGRGLNTNWNRKSFDLDIPQGTIASTGMHRTRSLSPSKRHQQEPLLFKTPGGDSWGWQPFGFAGIGFALCLLRWDMASACDDNAKPRICRVRKKSHVYPAFIEERLSVACRTMDKP